MSKKLILCCAFVLMGALKIFAQSTDSTSKANDKSVHYLGLQANQLFRQILNFSNSNSSIDNPYLLVYSVNSQQTGKGFSVGLGYSYIQTNDGDVITQRETTNGTFSIRVGYDKKSWIAKRWMVTAGFDAVAESDKNSSVTKNDTDFNKSKIETTSTSSGWGFGPRFGLSFAINNRIFIGTEANYYFKFLKDKLSVTSSIQQQEFDPNTGTTHWVTHNDSQDTSSKAKKFQLSVPAVLFLYIKF